MEAIAEFQASNDNSEVSKPAINIPANKRGKRANMYAESREIQLLVLQDAKDESLKPFIRAQLARAYRELGEFRLRLQGKGPPKAVDYAAKKPRTKAAKGFSETSTDAKPAKPAPKLDAV